MTDEPTPERAAPPAAKPTRRLDARSLRGLAHPLRMSIFEALSLDGPATATLLAERLGENTGTISWHLRHLAEHGFIEEETGRGTKRERWWRRVDVTNELNVNDFHDDPDARGAMSVYTQELMRQYFNRVMDWLSEEWEDGWRKVGTVSDWRDLRMTPDQLLALNEELAAVIARHTPAPDAEPAPDALPVVVQLQSFPRREHGSR
ncbi:helix-turn-helix domain-containing protein [Streptomyces scopuliridis]|uniref:Helix-turn-helix domain-containing protein n=1 Tax=Streptomyces scopuliridis TaxID=452529 RepID=A0ACD4ZDH4_9ACTN|nr:helix-turn-helix domain-containing protein [Streptomyces scopuliridis]WSB32252.1 helix-turn-helix domain-containing protein [Streptomyces scopuliridis]WSB96512.1 helix-turn-helix domain-containing protein [Streptomyces scopuliridis]WSC09784.1 helix-turn-helix domain-containing protein [Streptomyces scopuliridis]